MEYGYIFFHSDGSFAANRLESQKIILYPYGLGDPVTIVDTNPMAYTFEFASAPVKLSALPRGAMRSLGQVIDPKTGFLPKGGSLTYGYFTFTINDREFVGYATPDFRQFSIEITFDVAR